MQRKARLLQITTELIRLETKPPAKRRDFFYHKQIDNQKHCATIKKKVSMRTINIKYAVANGILTDIKEIDLVTFQRICDISNDITMVRGAQYNPSAKNQNVIAQKVQALRNKSAQVTPRYNQLCLLYNNLCRANKKILDHGRELEDMDAPIKMSWILTGTDRLTELKRHREKHASLYAQLAALDSEIRKLAPYAEPNINQTIQRETAAMHAELHEDRFNRFSNWVDNRNKKIDELKRELGVYIVYPYLLKDVHIRIDDKDARIACERTNIGESVRFEKFSTLRTACAMQITR